MTDLEINRLCAEAMKFVPPQTTIGGVPWNPLVFDAQAMALVKKFRIALGWNDPGWGAFRQDTKKWVNDTDLNRAVCLAVAKMQQAKKP